MGSGEWGMGNDGRRKTSATASASELPTPPSPFPISDVPIVSSVEETAVVVEALAAAAERPDVATAVERGALWLIEAVESGRFRQPSPIGFYFAKLWYYEKLYPLIFTVGALRSVVENESGGKPGG